MGYKIFVVDDHPLMRRGYASLINQEPDLKLCGEAGSADEALEKVQESRPDLVIADISMEGMNGIELIKHLHARKPDLPVLVVSMHDELLYAERALSAGARGYVMKNEVDTSVIGAINKILQGGLYVSERMQSRILAQYATGRHVERAPLEQLADRELEIFELIGRGMSTRQIAETLHISPKTVESHRGRIKAKLGIESTGELRQRAVLWLHNKKA